MANSTNSMDCLLGLFRGEVPQKTKALQSPCYDHQGDGRSRLRNKGCSRESLHHLSCVEKSPGLCRKAKGFPLRISLEESSIPLKKWPVLLEALKFGKENNEQVFCLYIPCLLLHPVELTQWPCHRGHWWDCSLRCSEALCLSWILVRSTVPPPSNPSTCAAITQVDGFLHDAMVIDPQTQAEEKNGKLNPPSATNSPKSSRTSPNPQPFPSAPFPAAQAHQQGRGSRDAHHGRHDLKDHHPVDAEERGPVGVRHLQVPVESAKSAL